MKNQKGITLIALIITIIVMLILVTVSITIALQSGLFEKAGEATSRTKTEQEAENKLGSGQANVEGYTDADKNVDQIANYYATKNYAD